MKIDSSASVELRKRATTWSPKQSTTLASDQNDSVSTNLYHVCNILLPVVINSFRCHLSPKEQSCDKCFITLGSNKPWYLNNAGMHLELIGDSIIAPRAGQWTRRL